MGRSNSTFTSIYTGVGRDLVDISLLCGIRTLQKSYVSDHSIHIGYRMSKILYALFTRKVRNEKITGKLKVPTVSLSVDLSISLLHLPNRLQDFDILFLKQNSTFSVRRISYWSIYVPYSRSFTWTFVTFLTKKWRKKQNGSRSKKDQSCLCA